MIYIGIDFSISSPCMCINNNNNIKWYTYTRKKDIKGITKKMLFHFSDCPYINTNTLSYITKTNDYSENEILKLYDSILLTNTITNHIKNELNNESKNIEFNKNELKIAIEGFSYNSKGKHIFDLPAAQYLLRERLINITENILIFPPSNVKKFATNKGNATKNLMCDTFLNYEHLPPKIKKYFNNNIHLIKTDKYFKKPFEDMVDSYFIMEMLKKFEYLK